ncbi:hypothetical protein O6H91_10G033900 [Diphasiastrum complanatum]|uniref:Uncharacterized protein n=1 Tax=Diphasiastrum complanatum TaxID=34168 RepID=A0ACC2CFZ0_DIPCM|nr:hypothetical protein O6H91_10G033900 [Diphasiastrum complanatum]
MENKKEAYADRYPKEDDLPPGSKLDGLSKNRFLENCRFEPIDSQHFCCACNEVVVEALRTRRLLLTTFESGFRFIHARICIFRDQSRYILESDRLNFEPKNKIKKSTLAEIMGRGRTLWVKCERPRYIKGLKLSPEQRKRMCIFYLGLRGVLGNEITGTLSGKVALKSLYDKFEEYT